MQQQREARNDRNNNCVLATIVAKQHNALQINQQQCIRRPISWTVLCLTKGLLHQPSNVGFTSKARRVGTLLVWARSSQVTDVHTQNLSWCSNWTIFSINYDDNACLLKLLNVKLTKQINIGVSKLLISIVMQQSSSVLVAQRQDLDQWSKYGEKEYLLSKKKARTQCSYHNAVEATWVWRVLPVSIHCTKTTVLVQRCRRKHVEVEFLYIRVTLRQHTKNSLISSIQKEQQPCYLQSQNSHRFISWHKRMGCYLQKRIWWRIEKRVNRSVSVHLRIWHWMELCTKNVFDA